MVTKPINVFSTHALARRVYLYWRSQGLDPVDARLQVKGFLHVHECR